MPLHVLHGPPCAGVSERRRRLKTVLPRRSPPAATTRAPSTRSTGSGAGGGTSSARRVPSAASLRWRRAVRLAFCRVCVCVRTRACVCVRVHLRLRTCTSPPNLRVGARSSASIPTFHPRRLSSSASSPATRGRRALARCLHRAWSCLAGFEPRLGSPLPTSAPGLGSPPQPLGRALTCLPFHSCSRCRWGPRDRVRRKMRRQKWLSLSTARSRKRGSWCPTTSRG